MWPESGTTFSWFEGTTWREIRCPTFWTLRLRRWKRKLVPYPGVILSTQLVCELRGALWYEIQSRFIFLLQMQAKLPVAWRPPLASKNLQGANLLQLDSSERNHHVARFLRRKWWITKLMWSWGPRAKVRVYKSIDLQPMQAKSKRTQMAAYPLGLHEGTQGENQNFKAWINTSAAWRVRWREALWEKNMNQIGSNAWRCLELHRHLLRKVSAMCFQDFLGLSMWGSKPADSCEAHMGSGRL